MVNRVGLDTMDSANPEKIHLESKRYAAEDQYGLMSFDTPSYRMCHPMSTLRATSPYNWASFKDREGLIL